MIERPSQRWRSVVEAEEAAVAAGTLRREEAAAAQFWPTHFVAAVDAALASYERDVARLDAAPDEAVWLAVERVALALNAIDDEEGLIESGERDELYRFIEDVLTGAGVDVAALIARRGLDDAELTSPWRRW
ncbi:MAG TPA: hypothetical protein VL738_34355 [Dactylosporangium sp.]|nr:hypothetical protein [Dactylosporangium sp.]